MAKSKRKQGKAPAPPAPAPPDEASSASSSDSDAERSYEDAARDWRRLEGREAALRDERASGTLAFAREMGVDDLSSDDEEAGNATGRARRRVLRQTFSGTRGATRRRRGEMVE